MLFSHLKDKCTLLYNSQNCKEKDDLWIYGSSGISSTRALTLKGSSVMITLRLTQELTKVTDEPQMPVKVSCSSQITYSMRVICKVLI